MEDKNLISTLLQNWIFFSRFVHAKSRARINARTSASNYINIRNVYCCPSRKINFSKKKHLCSVRSMFRM